MAYSLVKDDPDLAPGMGAGAGFDADFFLVIVYLRGDRHLVVVNRSGTARSVEIPSLSAHTARTLEANETAAAGGRVATGAFG
jgi:hypothetical protein